MSMTKRMIELEEKAQELVGALEAVLNDERLEHEAAVGIAKKIIADRSLDKLSEAQMGVFERHIKPAMTIACEGHCGENISWSDLPSSLANEMDYGLVCSHCAHDMERQRRD